MLGYQNDPLLVSHLVLMGTECDQSVRLNVKRIYGLITEYRRLVMNDVVGNYHYGNGSATKYPERYNLLNDIFNICNLHATRGKQFTALFVRTPPSLLIRKLLLERGGHHQKGGCNPFLKIIRLFYCFKFLILVIILFSKMCEISKK